MFRVGQKVVCVNAIDGDQSNKYGAGFCHGLRGGQVYIISAISGMFVTAGAMVRSRKRSETTKMLNVSYETKPEAKATTPTAHTYGGLQAAYKFFNAALFGGQLPDCLITLQKHKGAYGYFAPERFGSRDGKTTVHEIALNPETFAERNERSILSTLAHEQAHLWQQHFGKPSRNGYHNKEWGAKMHEIGLPPSSTGAPGGKETGQKVSHYIVDGGAFDRAFAALAAKGGVAELFIERWNGDDEKAAKAKAKKNASKTPFVCPECDLKAWAKPDASLMCGDCEVHMTCEAL